MLNYEGEIERMNESFKRLAQSLAMGLGLLFMVLVVSFCAFLHPLAVVAIGGLITGTFLTLVVMPVLSHLLKSIRKRLTGHMWGESR